MAADSINVEGIVTGIHKGGLFSVDAEFGKPPNWLIKPVKVKCSGKMTQYKIKLVRGDRVNLELSPYDPTKGRIIHRQRSK